MQQQYMPFGWPLPGYLPLPPIIDDRDLFINSVVTGGPSTPGPEGPAGPQGEAGVGIAAAEVTPNPGELILLLTDGTVLNAGSVIGPPGAAGNTGPLGAQGATGPQGPQGPPGSNGTCSTKTICEDYTATEYDCYIGCKLEDKATLTLPKEIPNGTRYSIKLEFGAPVGNRKLTVKPQEPSLINGVTAITLTTPHEFINVIYNNDNWWTI